MDFQTEYKILKTEKHFVFPLSHRHQSAYLLMKAERYTNYGALSHPEKAMATTPYQGVLYV